eukprot:Skav205640  [mRNA]  locus=scaffold458:41359:44140:+ [translate_table: standard]
MHLAREPERTKRFMCFTAACAAIACKELDTMPATVFMVGATNRPDLLDRSLLRPGRLDRMVYLGPGLLEVIAKACPPNLTGADVSVLCADAYSIAQREHIAKLHDLADALRVQISTLLLFLDSWEAHLSAKGSRPGTFQSLWSQADVASSQLSLLLLGSYEMGEAVVLAHHTGAEDHGFRDVHAAVALVSGQGPAADIAQSFSVKN